MIAKISSGKDTAGLIRYLYGPGRANEHTDPHLVASWDGFAPDPGRSNDFNATRKLLVADLDLRLHQAKRLGRAPKQPVWHCSLRASPEDRTLSDDEWAAIARRIVAATGIAPKGDPDGCRWVAVRHAEDHIHIAATKVRGDLRTARHWNDYLTADKELAAIEKDYGLHQVIRGDRTAAKRPTRAETEKAHRTGHQRAAREHLRSTVRTAVSVATSPEEFLDILTRTDNVHLNIQYFPSGDIRGYKVALDGDTNTAGDPIWHSGSKLAPDLSFPKIRERLTDLDTPPTTAPGNRRRPNPWHQATAAAERIPHRLVQSDDAAAQAHIAAFGEALDALPLLAPTDLRPQLRQAAITFERATRSRIRAQQDQARALRSAIRALRSTPVTGDGSGLAMFLEVALLVVTAAAHWHRLRQHDQQVTAAHQTLLHLRTAYEEAAVAPLVALARRKPPQQVVDRLAHQVRQVVPAYAVQVLSDPAWDALATVLTDAERSGHAPERILQQVANERALDDARSPAQVLVWRVHRLAQRSAPIPRLAEVLGVPATFFLVGRPANRLDASMAHFRSLRSTPKSQRERALAFAEQIWELTYALEKRIQLPLVDLPGFAGGEVHPGAELPTDPAAAARELRRRWRLGEGPVTHLVRRMESHGIIVVMPPASDPSAATVDAFSTRAARPLVILTANRADDVYRHRFTAAHELGHLVLHGDATGDSRQEKEADAFAAEFLTPQDSILPLLPKRMDLAKLAELRRVWGVSIHSLVYRCRELGLISDATASRTYQRLRALDGQPGFTSEAVSNFSGEQPSLLRQAFELACKETNLSAAKLAHELAWTTKRVRDLLGVQEQRPVLRLVQ